MFSAQSAEVFQVARFFNVSPIEVLDWPNPLFIEAQEFMEVQHEVDYRLNKRALDDNGH